MEGTIPEECAFVGQESKPNSAEPDALCCDGGATVLSNLIMVILSSILNCTDITERAVPIHTARGSTVMTTTHVCLKTYYVWDRIGGLRPIATKTYIVRISIMIYYHSKCLTKQDIESISIKIQKNLGYLRRFFGQ